MSGNDTHMQHSPELAIMGCVGSPASLKQTGEIQHCSCTFNAALAELGQERAGLQPRVETLASIDVALIPEAFLVIPYSRYGLSDSTQIIQSCYFIVFFWRTWVVFHQLDTHCLFYPVS